MTTLPSIYFEPTHYHSLPLTPAYSPVHSKPRAGAGSALVGLPLGTARAAATTGRRVVARYAARAQATMLYARKFDDDDYVADDDDYAYGEDDEEDERGSAGGHNDGDREGSVFEAAFEDVRRAVEARMGDLERSIDIEGRGDQKGSEGQGKNVLVQREMVDQVSSIAVKPDP